MMSAHEAMNAGLAYFKKLNLGRFAVGRRCMSRLDFSLPMMPARSSISITNRVTKSAVNMLAKIPMVRVTPNPFTGPFPM